MFMVNGRKARLLIVDDKPDIKEVLCDLLGGRYECQSAGSAEEALTLLHRRRFDLILSDIMMDGMTGLEMVPHVRKLAPDIMIIMVSGAEKIDSAINALRVGAFDYIMKPFDVRYVVAAVERALEHRALRDAKRRYETQLERMVERRTAELGDALETLEHTYRSTLKALAAALETRDVETHGHSERVVRFSLRLGRELGLDEGQLKALEFGALLHDIGKIGVSDMILRKPSALTEEEWVKMRQHPLHGQQILRGIEFLEDAARVVGQHHEKWDGSGYPLGLGGEEIDLNARIFAVADAFDALTSDRVYRAKTSYGEAAAELDRCSGQHFDPGVVAAFHRISPEEWEELRRPIGNQKQAQRAVNRNKILPITENAIPLGL
jgi:putative nucleotidyltransferase with HDIG domain